MRYELLLQAKEPGAPYDPSPVDQALAARGVVQTPEGLRWRLKAGEVEVRLLIEGGRSVATELRVPLSEKLDLVRELVVEGAAVAAQAGALLFDPQLTKGLSANDEGLVAEQFLRTAKYAGEMMGLPEAVGASYSGDDPTALKPGTKVLLGLVGLLVALYLLVDVILG
ncbi:MAG: hypothetical protein ACYC8T_30650 [Myxococcaceae bacterium]